MQSRRTFAIALATTGLGFGGLSLLGGCRDDSKTTGTQVTISPEVKAELDDMKTVQKEERAARKEERAAAKRKRR